MGIKAPTSSDYATLILSSLLSYSHPIILLAVFTVSFVIAYLLIKKALVSTVAALIITLLLALYFIYNDLSAVRF